MIIRLFYFWRFCSAMMGKQEDKQNRFVYINLDEFVPKQHLLRKIEEIVDFSLLGKI